VNLRHLASGIVAASVVLAAGAGAFAHPKPKPHARPAAPSVVKTIAAKKTVVFTVNAGQGAGNSGMNFDGYANGQMTVTVPTGWTVDVVFKNVGGLPHSVVFEPFKENMNSQNPLPAFKGAQSPSPVAGTAPGSGANFHFVANKAGKYRIICAYPGHAALGMWDVLMVKPGIKSASVKA